jgi:hypothetical protein
LSQGLTVTRLVSGFGQLLQTRARTPTYWVHTLWMVNVLLTMIITWWVQYRWRNAPHWTLFLFVVARRAADSLSRRRTALSHQR